MQEVQPDEIYNLAAQSHVKVSFETAEYTGERRRPGHPAPAGGRAAARPDGAVRFYQASTSEMFGTVREVPQRETTPFHPRSPYGAAKVYAYWSRSTTARPTACTPATGSCSTTSRPAAARPSSRRKITRAAARIALGLRTALYLGNLDARRDWGYAKDYVDAMWRMLQQAEPDDYVVATGESHSVREFAEAAFTELGVALEWRGAGREEVGVVAGVDAGAFLRAERETDGETGGRGDGGKETEHRTSNIEHRTSKSIRNPKSEIRNLNHEPHEPHERVPDPEAGPKSEVRSPMSAGPNPQSAIRNPQLDPSAIRNPQWEIGVVLKPGATVVRIDPKYFRPAEVDQLLGDPAKAREKLGWTPTVRFPELVREMVRHDLSEAVKDIHLMQGGFRVRTGE